jgi:hypothetical protein
MKKLLVLLITLSVVVSCRKDDTSFDGNNIQEMYSDFKVLSAFNVDRDSVNFANGEKAIFSAKFNKPVSWKIVIKGQTSKAEKIITGQTKFIDATNATWNGSTTIFPMFKEENCTAQLTIDGVADTFQLQTKIKAVKINLGLVIADFENGFNNSWLKFVQTGANMDFNIKTDTLCPQGAKYLRMAGTVNWDYLIGLIDYPATAYGTTKTLNLPANPNDVYFNCLIYGESASNPSIVLFQFKEDENADGNINSNTDDQYDYQINVNWIGWKLITVKYADLVTLVNGQPSTPKGNSQHNPDKIGKISMLHLADPSQGFAACKMDYIIFTNAPLEP